MPDPAMRSGQAPRGRRFSRGERRTQILTEAAQIFAESGFTRTTTRAIAEACGITEAALYKHFSGKEELFQEALRAKLEEHDAEGFLADLPADQPVLTTFRAIAARILEVGLADPTIHRLLIATTLSGLESTYGLYVSWRLPFVAYLEKVVVRGIDRGELRPVDPLLTSRAFVGLVMDCVLSCDLWGRLGYPGYTPEQLLANNVPTFVRGLLPDPEQQEAGID